MSMLSALLALFSGPTAKIAFDAAPPMPKAPPEPFNFDMALREALNRGRAQTSAPQVNPFLPHYAGLPPEVRKSGMAMDDVGAFGPTADWAYTGLAGLGFDGREGFIGYAPLSILATVPEYRRPTDIIAEDATSQWIELQSAGEKENKTKIISQIEEDMVKFSLKNVFHQALKHDGYFGRGHIYVDTGDTDKPGEIITPIEDKAGELSPAKVGKGKLQAFRNVEPLWVYAQKYNSTDPLQADWYRPSQWLIQSKTVDASRMLTLISRPVPDLLKPAYYFGGMSITQMARPVVENWLRTRKNVGDAINNFSTMVLMTDVVNKLLSDPSGANLFARAEFYNLARDSRGLYMIDKNAEDFKNVSMPLGGLSDLQAQSQEHQCSLFGIPVIRYLGIQPSGMNASSAGEIAIYKQNIVSMQEYLLRPAITKALQILQLNRFGRIDPDITFRFKPLETTSALEKAELEKLRADTATVHIANRTVARQEERSRIANDPDTPYDSLDADKPVEMEPEAMATVAQAATAAITSAFSEGITDRATALKELKKLSKITGIGSEISDELIEEAEEEPPMPGPEELKAQARMEAAGGAVPSEEGEEPANE